MEPREQPHYSIDDREKSPNSELKVYIIVIDSDDGRTYEKLSTDAERLEYMRKHVHDNWDVVQLDTVFFEDNKASKTYNIKINSPEYEGLKKFLQEDESTPLIGTKEFDMVQYYREHATSVEDAPISSCDLNMGA
ncbi:uncharacterized protein F4807DRAFT_470630 [Annulohypoxylon truncatum]|uniref:uncharacterized protein n=1 Tax=Annulohypoxylon truncatum TaxID=327061 RepID=UPI0020089C30|nr:uncharacterized protein F4807DRAFT_470630 [Annulohypoxylon truncatum]KAI1205863.1 hypothetical protein F4807DRAFT_470630 [Annulohypoxylon truncatum]